ncbi:DUF5723 family protein, partial [Bacteroidales bacterium OttesenSCG-928-I21]|nr:DUF5723 family protein [Bacteroidales bacterium OttesenSCG-928-I21]
MKKYVVSILILTLTSTISFAQQGLTFYKMDRVLQSSNLNVARNSPYKLEVGGLLIPVFGQLPPSMYFNAANNSLYYNHIFHKGVGEQADSLIFDKDLFMSKLKNTTNIRFETQLELLNIGIKLKNDGFVFISLSEKIKGGVSIPYDLLELAINGNAPYMRQNKTHDLSTIDFNATYYHEVALGYSGNVGRDLRLGANVKLLLGQANVSTNIKNLSIKTSPDKYYMTAYSDMSIQSSLPIYYDYENTDDTLFFELNSESVDSMKIQDLFLNTKNVGAGIDIGFNYNINKNLEVFG